MTSKVSDKDFAFAASLIKVIAVIIALMVAAISKYSFIFFSASMLPTIFAIFFDRNNHKCFSATICSFNLIGVLPYLIRIWESNNIDYVSKDVLSSPNSWIVIYGATLIGYLIYFSLPILIAKLYTLRNRVQIQKYQKEHDKICSKWGMEKKDWN